MIYWKTKYIYKNYKIDCIIKNNLKNFKLNINNINFISDYLDLWELSEKNIKKNTLPTINYKKNHILLLYELIEITIPTKVFSLKENLLIKSEIKIKLSQQINNNNIKIICKEFLLKINNEIFKASELSEFFDISLNSICKQISGKYYLYNCFGCIYSDYSPYGNGNIGNMICFEKYKEKYLIVNGKYKSENYITIWDLFDNKDLKMCQETQICKKFKPRINCIGGYRGTIY